MIISDFLSHFADKKLITARQCIKVLAQIGQTNWGVKELDLSEKQSTGIPIILNELKKNGSQEPEFDLMKKQLK